jgi:Ca2+-binding RTX toxin-like protein
MKLRALVTALVVPSALAVTGPIGSSYAATSCQGRPATIQGAGTVTGTDGDDVIVATGRDSAVSGGAGNDVICTGGGSVETGAGDDSVLSTAPRGVQTYVVLADGHDSYVGGAGKDDVVVDGVTHVDISMGSGSGLAELYPTSVPGTGSIDFGKDGGFLNAFGESSSSVDLAHRTATVDGLLTVSVVGASGTYATGDRVRVTGDRRDNVLSAVGCDLRVKGGGGDDTVSRVGNGFDIDLPPCRNLESRLEGGGGNDQLFGWRGPDVLIGGHGHDKARGQRGTDVCRAEVEIRCER